jgi:hypothetical protein
MVEVDATTEVIGPDGRVSPIDVFDGRRLGLSARA